MAFNPSYGGYRLRRVITLTASSGTYTPSSDCTAIRIKGVAAGGNGGSGVGSSGTLRSSGGGAASGGYFEDFITSLAASFAYTVGTTHGANTTFVATAGTYTALGGADGTNGVGVATLSIFAGGNPRRHLDWTRYTAKPSKR